MTLSNPVFGLLVAMQILQAFRLHNQEINMIKRKGITALLDMCTSFSVSLPFI